MLPIDLAYASHFCPKSLILPGTFKKSVNSFKSLIFKLLLIILNASIAANSPISSVFVLLPLLNK